MAEKQLTYNEVLTMQSILNKILQTLLLTILTMSFSYADAPVNGKFSTALVSQNVLPIDDRGHILRLAEASGTNKGGFLDGWTANNKEIDDLIQGNGTQSGHLVFSRGKENVAVEWQGLITTVLGENNQPMTSFNGKWSFTGGTGSNSGIQGRGTYKGYFTSETEYTVEWKGFRK
jgi:hypothetical protein